MKINLRHIIIFLVSTSISVSCQKIFFNDDEGTRELVFGDFHAVEISGIYNILLIQDSTNRLVITGKNKIGSVDAVLDNDTLVIDDHKNMSLNQNRNTLEIHFRNLDYLLTNDPVNVSNQDTLKTKSFLYVAIGEIEEVSLTVVCNDFYIVNSANTLGYFYFKGTAENCTFFNRYGSGIFADSLYCRNAEVVNESVGDVHVNASEKIKAFIWGPGNIYYHGSPVIEIAEKTGDGRMIKADQM